MKYIKILLVNLLFIFLVTPAFAVDPITPPDENTVITNNSDIYVTGSPNSFIEDEKCSIEHICGTVTITVDDIVIYESSVAAAEMNYSDDIMAVDGDTRIKKDFLSDLAPEEDKPNIKVARYINFDGSSLTSTEKGGVRIFHFMGADTYVELGNVCIVVNEACWDVAAGSHLNVSRVSANSATDLAMTTTPSIQYSLDAEGSGLAKAGMEMVFEEGKIPLLEACEQMGHSGSGTEEKFSEHTAVRGEFKFYKSMKAIIPTPKTHKTFFVP